MIMLFSLPRRARSDAGRSGSNPACGWAYTRRILGEYPANTREHAVPPTAHQICQDGARRVWSAFGRRRVRSSSRNWRIRSMLDTHRVRSASGTRRIGSLPSKQRICSVLDARRACSAFGARHIGSSSRKQRIRSMLYVWVLCVHSLRACLQARG